MTLKHIRPDIIAMPEVPYGLVSVEEVAERQGLTLDRIVKLDANENLYGPSPKAMAALADESTWNIYPDLTHQAINAALAGYAGVAPEQIVATSGCDELILLLVQLLVGPGDHAIDNLPTFSVYDWSVRVMGGHSVVVPRLRDQQYAVDVPAILGAINDHTRLIWLCSPNNPTGGLTPQRDIEILLNTGVVVAVDETYFEFSSVTMLPLLQRYENLVIMRSLSKWAALAGLRVGYGIFHPEVARQMRKLRGPFNVNKAGYVAALASLADRDYLLANVARIVQERQRLMDCLGQFSFLRCYPSRGNFILSDVNGVAAQTLRDELEKEGILARVYHSRYLPNTIRFSVGKPEHTEAAVMALTKVGQRLNLP